MAHSEVLTVGYLFMENDDWVNNEEALVFQKIEDLIREYKKDNNKHPTILYISKDEELQSYYMWFASTYGLKYKKTEGNTHVG